MASLLNRRTVTLLAVACLLVTACGDDDDTSTGTTEVASETSASAADSAAPATTTEPDEDFDPEGVLRYSYDLQGSGGIAFDPGKQITGFDQIAPVYDTLLRSYPDGSVGPGLAKSAAVVDPTTVKLTLQEGVSFSDGAAFDAAAVKAGIERNLSQPGPGFRVEYREVSEIVVDSATELTVKLKTPVAGTWVTLLNAGEGMIVSPKAVAEGVDLATSPVGAGPFVLESYDPTTKIVLKKNPDYFQADDIRLAGLEYVHIQDPSAAVTALLAGQIDLIWDMPSALVPSVRGQSDFTVQSEQGPNTWMQLQICKKTAPFDDPQVREAVALAIDREALGAAMYADVLGESPDVGGYWPEGHPFRFDWETANAHDPERAKLLFAQAGVSELTFGAFYSPGDSQRILEIVQAQLAEVGVTANLVTTTNIFEDFIKNGQQPTFMVGMQRQQTGKVTRILGTGSAGNACQYSDPTLDGLMAALAAADQLTPSAEAVDLWRQVQQYIADNTLMIDLVFRPQNVAWSDNVGGVELIQGYSTGSMVADIIHAQINA